MRETFPFDIGTVHIIGIGGIGMSGYAEVLHILGYKVQGSDQSENANVARLRDMGIRVEVGHRVRNIYDLEDNPCSVVVKSTAVKEDNMEIMAAHACGIPVIPRVELLSEIMRSKWCINISGTHGKTTTTSILGHLLQHNGQDPTIINGGIINSLGTNARVGKSDWMVVEADESDGTFSKLPSVFSVITNIDPEHLDYYKTYEREKREFVRYIQNLPFYGYGIVCIDHPAVRELLPKFKRNVITYGFSEDAQIRAFNVRNDLSGFTYDVTFSDEFTDFPKTIENVKIPLFGKHNVLNSLTAFAVGHRLGFAYKDIVETLSTLSGVKRRFTKVGEFNNILVIDDYAHHPTEIEAVLAAARCYITDRGEGKIISVFQPHRYSRVLNLFDGFCRCFTLSDEVVVMDVYAAGEQQTSFIGKEALASGIRKYTKAKVHTLKNKEKLPVLIDDIAKPGDIVICMGAGDITKCAYALPDGLKAIADSKLLEKTE